MLLSTVQLLYYGNFANNNSHFQQLMVHVYPIPAFTDNYIWCLHNDTDAVIVDPGDASPVLAYLEQQQLILRDILITHHHADHIGGLRKLVSPEVTVFGPVSNRIPYINKALGEGDKFHLDCLDLELQVMHVPGHTREHIAYYGEGKLFCGDTLFSGGCGRLFEGTPEQMHKVFQRYRQLPGDTHVYCTHEYTLANLQFAETLTPDCAELQSYKRWVTEQREQDKPTLPGNIEQELKINPYMRVADAQMIAALTQITGTEPMNEIAAFAAIRKLKDNF